jgi:DNA polymerase-3 subunit epsilon
LRWPLRLQRWRWQRRGAAAALVEAWGESAAGSRQDWRSAGLLVCDAEMSSLDARQGELLSLGWVAIDDGCITLASARHILLRAQQGVGQSATIHRLRDCELNDGVHAAVAMEQLLAAATGRILVFHNARLDLAYLNRQAMEVWAAPLCWPVIDTLRLEQQGLRGRDQPIRPADLQLATCRRRYGLPEYPAHNALWDALATAELLLAQVSHRGGAQSLCLGELGV